MSPLFGQITLIGMGLIGSSIARAAREKSLCTRITAVDQSADVRSRVVELGLADVTTDNIQDGVRGADLVILCVPVGANGSVAATMRNALKTGAIVSDVGSVKGEVVRLVAPHIPAGVHFVPAHPVAGTENSGPDAGFAALFNGPWCILTPPEGTDPGAITKLRAFWEAIGSRVEIMAPDHHDLVLAVTSHLPHLIAFNIMGTASDLETVTASEVIKFSAGGFRDFTRIAASDPTMWRDVFLNNREAVLDVLGRFQEDLFSLQRAIRWGDGDKLFEFFSRTRDLRRGITETSQATENPPVKKLNKK
jgi:cyclohexadieny/prephenate dehydrogenase